jgi:hypothetical protein
MKWMTKKRKGKRVIIGMININPKIGILNNNVGTATRGAI